MIKSNSHCLTALFNSYPMDTALSLYKTWNSCTSRSSQTTDDAQHSHVAWTAAIDVNQRSWLVQRESGERRARHCSGPRWAWRRNLSWAWQQRHRHPDEHRAWRTLVSRPRVFNSGVKFDARISKCPGFRAFTQRQRWFGFVSSGNPRETRCLVLGDLGNLVPGTQYYMILHQDAFYGRFLPPYTQEGRDKPNVTGNTKSSASGSVYFPRLHPREKRKN